MESKPLLYQWLAVNLRSFIQLFKYELCILSAEKILYVEDEPLVLASSNSLVLYELKQEIR